MEGKERESNIDVRNINGLPLVRPVWGLNLQPWPEIEPATFRFARWCPANWATLVRAKTKILMRTVAFFNVA